MTREEAITRLHWLKRELIKGNDMNEPLDMAISALQQTDSDLISRAAALEEMAQAECGLHYADCEADNCSCSYIKRILDIPSADRPALPTEMNGVKISDAIKWADEWLNEYATGREWSCVRALRDFTETALMELPSDEQVTSKLKNPCDSLLTEDSEDSKEQKSKLDSDLISRAELLEKMLKEAQRYDNDDIRHGYHNCVCLVYDAQSVSADRPTGEWIEQNDRNITQVTYFGERKCSKCGEISLLKSLYCPNCGAKMVKE